MSSSEMISSIHDMFGFDQFMSHLFQHLGNQDFKKQQMKGTVRAFYELQHTWV